MTDTAFLSLIRKKTRTTSTTTGFADSDVLVFANAFKDEIAGRIQQLRPEVWNNETTDNLVANTRTYDFPSGVINSIDSVEFMFDPAGDTDEDYKVATPLKRRPSNIALQEESIVDEYDNDEPYYFIRGRGIFILSGTIQSVTNGIKWVINKFPTDLANFTGGTELFTLIGFPVEFQELWARRVSMEYKDINRIALSPMESNYQVDLELALENFSTVNQDEQTIANTPSSQSLGNDGYDY